MPRTPAKVTQAEIARALRAVAQAGVEAVVKVEGGAIVILPPKAYNPATKPDEDFEL